MSRREMHFTSPNWAFTVSYAVAARARAVEEKPNYLWLNKSSNVD